MMSASTHYTWGSEFIHLNLIIITTTKYKNVTLIGWLPLTDSFFQHMQIYQTPI
uniref:Uncharacterized protein n=1 Tax=Medicago truncatula TaxID=3880 RepID=B7FKZ8_MEDTR|nr:unknown [Medicago truncatula]